MFRSDSLQIGDWLIAVNGIKVTTLRQEEILSLLRNATDMICLTIEYDLNDHCKFAVTQFLFYYFTSFSFL